MKKFSFTEYFKALLFSTPGTYRLFAFIITSDPLRAKDNGIAFEEAQNWLGNGMLGLPQSIGEISISEAHQCIALVYHFKQKSRDEQIVFMNPSDLPGQIHLHKSGILKP